MNPVYCANCGDKHQTSECPTLDDAIAALAAAPPVYPAEEIVSDRMFLRTEGGHVVGLYVPEGAPAPAGEYIDVDDAGRLKR